MSQIIAVTAEDVQKHIKELLSQVHMRILITGNMYKDVRAPTANSFTAQI